MIAAPSPWAGIGATAIRATPVNIPLKAPYRWSVGIYPGFSKTIVEAHDGTIVASDREGGGASFRIELPALVRSKELVA